VPDAGPEQLIPFLIYLVSRDLIEIPGA